MGLYDHTFWWEHPRYDVWDTLGLRLAYVGLGVVPVIELYVLGPFHHNHWLLMASALQVVAWIVGMQVVLARNLYLTQKRQWRAMVERHRRWDDEWGDS